jgi:hypothetical protein
MALKSFSALAPNECVAHAEVRDAVESGQLQWAGQEPEWPYDPYWAERYVYTRADYEAAVRHTSMAGSGIALDELMSKSEMLAYRDITIPVPSNFSAVHDVSACPQRRVVLTWTADVEQGSMVLYHRDVFGTWYTLDTIAAGVETYVHAHPGPHVGRNDYQIRYSAQSEIADIFAMVLCPF